MPEDIAETRSIVHQSIIGVYLFDASGAKIAVILGTRAVFNM